MPLLVRDPANTSAAPPPVHRLGNAFSIWLGVNPPSLFFYAFLPPLLLDSALSLDYFLFKKVMLQILAFAFLVSK